MKGPRIHLPKPHGPRLRHTETPCQCESTRLPKPPFPLPNVAFRTDKKKALRRTWKAHVYTCQSPTAPGSATPKPHASASRHGCRNHPFHCLTLLLEPIRRMLYAELERPTYTFAKAPGANLRHSQTPCQREPPAPRSATPKPHSSASRHGCRNHPFHCLTLLLEPIRKKLYAELERPTYTLAKAPRPQAPPHRNPMPVRVDTAAETTLSTA